MQFYTSVVPQRLTLSEPGLGDCAWDGVGKSSGTVRAALSATCVAAVLAAEAPEIPDLARRKAFHNGCDLQPHRARSMSGVASRAGAKRWWESSGGRGEEAGAVAYLPLRSGCEPLQAAWKDRVPGHDYEENKVCHPTYPFGGF